VSARRRWPNHGYQMVRFRAAHARHTGQTQARPANGARAEGDPAATPAGRPGFCLCRARPPSARAPLPGFSRTGGVGSRGDRGWTAEIRFHRQPLHPGPRSAELVVVPAGHTGVNNRAGYTTDRSRSTAAAEDRSTGSYTTSGDATGRPARAAQSSGCMLPFRAATIAASSSAGLNCTISVPSSASGACPGACRTRRPPRSSPRRPRSGVAARPPAPVCRRAGGQVDHAEAAGRARRCWRASIGVR
jgi:hypothetical protein